MGPLLPHEPLKAEEDGRNLREMQFREKLGSFKPWQGIDPMVPERWGGKKWEDMQMASRSKDQHPADSQQEMVHPLTVRNWILPGTRMILEADYLPGPVVRNVDCLTLISTLWDSKQSTQLSPPDFWPKGLWANKWSLFKVAKYMIVCSVAGENDRASYN